MPHNLTAEKSKSDAAEIMRRCREFIDLLHDLDGTKRGQPGFTDPGLEKSRGHVEEVAYLATAFVKRGGA